MPFYFERIKSFHRSDMKIHPFIVGSSLASIAFSVAAGCKNFEPCGKVVHKTPWAGKWADFRVGGDKCHVYN